MTAPDTSVVVAAFARWHEAHERASAAFQGRQRLVGHVALETLSVLTRMPADGRASAASVLEFLTRHFPDPPLTLDGDGHGGLLRRLAGGRIVGGAVYDALVAETARSAGATLLSLDTRAAPTYEAIGVEFRLLS